HARLGPGSQATPASGTADAKSLGGQSLPCEPCAQHKDNAPQAVAIIHIRVTAFGLLRMSWQERQDLVPQVIRQKLVRHGSASVHKWGDEPLSHTPWGL